MIYPADQQFYKLEGQRIIAGLKQRRLEWPAENPAAPPRELLTVREKLIKLCDEMIAKIDEENPFKP